MNKHLVAIVMGKSGGPRTLGRFSKDNLGLNEKATACGKD